MKLEGGTGDKREKWGWDRELGRERNESIK